MTPWNVSTTILMHASARGRNFKRSIDPLKMHAHARGEGTGNTLTSREVKVSPRPRAREGTWLRKFAQPPLGHALLVPLLAKVLSNFCKIAIFTHVIGYRLLCNPQPFAAYRAACLCAVYPCPAYDRAVWGILRSRCASELVFWLRRFGFGHLDRPAARRGLELGTERREHAPV